MKYVLFALLLGLGLCVGCAPAGDTAPADDNLSQVESQDTTTQVSVVKIDVPGIT